MGSSFFKQRRAYFMHFWPVLAFAAICAVYFLFSACRTIEYFIASGNSVPQAEAVTPALSKDDRAAMLKEVTSANLFKEARAVREVAPVSSALNSLELKGTFAGSQDAPSYAMITGSGLSKKLFQVGDIISGEITLEAIYSDHVTIKDRDEEHDLPLRKTNNTTK